MSFPISPVNGQTTVTNNITYSYNSTIGAWTRVAALVTATNSLLIASTVGVNSTITGALQVAGGAGIGGGLYVGGTVTATLFSGSFSGSVTQANNLNSGAIGLIPYQTGPNATSFIGAGTQGSILQMGTTTASFVTSSTIQVGFAATAGAILAANTTTTQVGFAVTAGTLLASNTSTTFVGLSAQANNLLGGAGGNLVYQTAPGVTGFVSNGQSGQVLVSNAGSAPSWSTLSASAVGTATNISGGALGQIPYQTGLGTTAFIGTGTQGTILQMGANNTASFVTTSSVQVGLATTATSLYNTSSQYVAFAGRADAINPLNTGTQYVAFAGRADAINPLNTGTQYVAFAGRADAINPLNTSTQYVAFAGRADAINPLNTSTQYVGNAVTAEKINPLNTSTQQVGYSANILGGTTGDLLYQSGANATAKLTASATAGALLASAGASTAPQYVTQVKAITSGAGSASQATGQTLVVTANGLGVTGDSYFANNVGVNGNIAILSVNANTQTATSNSLYVAGGAWVDRGLVVNGDTTFSGNVTFSGTTTNIISTNTYYTDNILELHTPPSGVNGTWITNDGKDIGFRFHYYDTADKNAALVMANDTRALEWYQSGAEGTFPNGAITSGVYGTFRTGKIVLAGTTTPSGTTSETTGDLQVAGGVGIGGGLYVKNVVTASTLILGNALGVPSGGTGLTTLASGSIPYGNGTGAFSSVGIGSSGQILTVNGGGTAPVWTSISGLTAGNATTATNLALGTAGQVPYQTGAGATSFFGPGTAGQILLSGGTAAPVYTNTSSIQVGFAATAGAILAANTTTTQVGFAVTAGAILAANTTTTQVGFAVTAGTLLASNTSTTFVGLATTATSLYNTGSQYVAFAGRADAINPLNTSTQYVGNAVTAEKINPLNTSSQFVGSAAQANNINGGLLGQIHYQTAAGTTGFISTATQGTILQMGANTPAFATTSSIQVGLATTATSLYNTSSQYVAFAGRADAINPLNTGTQYVAFAGRADAINPLNTGTQYVGNAVTAEKINPLNTSTQYVGLAAQSNNVIGGLANQIPYQTAPGITTFSAGLTYNGTTLTATNHVVSGTSSSNNTTTGALVVNGGVGIGQDLWVGGNINVNGSIFLKGAGLDQITSTTGTFVNAVVTGTNATNSTNTGALQVAGGVGIAGGLVVGGTITATTFVGAFSGTVTQANNLNNGTAGQLVYQSAPNTTAFAGPGTAGQILLSGGTSAPTYTNTSSIQVGFAATAGALLASSTSTTFVGLAAQANNLNGASGQIPYQSALNTTAFSSGLAYDGTTLATGNIKVTGTTQATATNTGALQVVGGVGVGGNLFVGGSSYIAGDLYVDGTQFVVNTQALATGDKALVLSTGSSSAALASNAGVYIGPSSGTAYTSFYYDGIGSWIIPTGGTSGGLKIQGTTAAGVNTAAAGALQVSGGVGIAGGLYVGGTITATTFVGSFSGSVTQANNLNNGTAGQLVYQSAPNLTGFVGPGTAGQILLSGGTSAPTYTTTSSVGVGFAANLFSGATGSIPYQTGPNATVFLAGGSQGQFLRYGSGNAPIWSSTGTFSGGTASTATTALQSVTVSTGGVGVTGNSNFANDVLVGGTMYAGNIATAGTVVGGGVRSTTSATPPASPTVGDIWYATGTDDIYRYTTDGSTSFWLDISGPSVANSAVGLVSLATLKATVAASTSFADFQTRIAAL